MIIKMNGKKISKKKAEELIGKKKLQQRIEEAKQAYAEDPLEEISWIDGMEIEF